ncbi:MAG: M14 family zinc carboxypeptidase [Candidatus Natronoplasma sp.]
MRVKVKFFSVAVILLLASLNLSFGLGTGAPESESLIDVDENELARPVDENSTLTSEEYPFKEEYPSVNQLYEWYENLEEEFPELVDKHHYGESYEGRDLWVLEITSDNDTVVDEKPAVLIDATIHAREWSTTQVAAYFTWRLLDEYNTNETINWVVNNRKIFVVPMVNPDGYIHDGNGTLGQREYWRKNRNDSIPKGKVGVDLNRNWDYLWENGEDDPSMETYRGEAPFSEAETKHLKEFILENDIDSYQNLHSHWGALLIPSTNMTNPTPHDDWYRGTAEHMTSMTTMLGEDEQYSYGQPHEEIGYGAPGAADNWVYDEIGAQAYTYEIYTGEWEDSKHGFYPEEDKIMEINQDVDDSLIYQARVADTDLGDGEEIKQPPVPYLVYGTLEDEEGKAHSDVEIEVKNRETEETIYTHTDRNGHYEINLADLEEGYQERDLFTIEIEPGTTRLNFEVDDSWGQRLDLEYSESAQVTTEGFSNLTLDSVNLLGDVTLADEGSVDAYFEYGITGEKEWEESKVEEINENRTYNIELDEDDLQVGEEYEFRAVIEWNNEINRGRSITFVVDEYELDIDSFEGGEVKLPGEEGFDYIYGREVEIEASAEEGFEFIRWIGDVEMVGDTESKSTSVKMMKDLKITALFWAGEGTENNPYIIQNVYHLPEIHENLDAHFELADDIDASETKDWNDRDGFEPIGYMEEGFTGTLEGKGHEIQGLHINRSDEMGVGIFDAIGEDGEINDLRLVDLEVTGQMQVGGFASINEGKIKNSSATGVVIGKGMYGAGGLVSDCYGDIEDSYFEGRVKGNEMVGGLVAYMGGWREEAIPSNVKRSYAHGNVSGDEIVGGLVGWNGDGGSISQSYAADNISARQGHAGGLVAMNFASVTNTYSTGTVKASTHCGGLIGESQGNVFYSYSTAKVAKNGRNGGLIAASNDVVMKSYWHIFSSGVERSAGGRGMTTGEMIGENTEFTMEGFDFDEIWDVEEEPYSYPYLSWQDEDNIPYVPYELEHELTIEVDGRGSIEPESSTYLYPEGEEVSIEAISDELVEFSHWEGDVPEGYEKDEEITIVMEDDVEITANFEYEPWFQGLVSLIVLSVVIGGGIKIYKRYRKEEESDEEILVPEELKARGDTKIETCPECDEAALVIYEDGSALCENCSHAERGRELGEEEEEMV